MIKTALILAGGMGTRLRPLTDHIPKPLIPVGDKPLLQHIIDNFCKYGIKNIILCVGYKAEQIEEYFGNGEKCGVKINYSRESLPLGTGGAIKQAAKGLNGPLFMQWGDNLMDLNWNEVEKEYLKNKTPVLMVLTPREDVENFGVAELKDNKIVHFVEKPSRKSAPSNLINAGALVIDPKILNLLPEGKSSIERDCFEKIAPKGKISAYLHQGQWFPTDTLEKYEQAKSHFKPS